MYPVGARCESFQKTKARQKGTDEPPWSLLGKAPREALRLEMFFLNASIFRGQWLSTGSKCRH